MLTGVEEHAISFYRVYMPNGGGKGDIADGVGLTLLQNFNTGKIVFQVGEDNWLGLQGISRGEQPAAGLKPTLGHRLNHNICICRMVEVAVRQDDSAELIRSELSLSRLNDTAGAGVKEYFNTT